MVTGAPAVLMIIARSERKLYHYVHERFRDEPEVAVLFDRRLVERRRSRDTSAPDRRQAERRRPEPDDRLKAHGWLVIQRRDDGRVGGVQGDQ